MNVGDLVVVPSEPGLGVGRVERVLTVHGAQALRIFLYETGNFVVRGVDVTAPCPAGVWPPPVTSAKG